MDEVGPALRRAAEIVAAYREGLSDARVTPDRGSRRRPSGARSAARRADAASTT